MVKSDVDTVISVLFQNCLTKKAFKMKAFLFIAIRYSQTSRVTGKSAKGSMGSEASLR
jgi:hypothetical protein